MSEMSATFMVISLTAVNMLQLTSSKKILQALLDLQRFVPKSFVQEKSAYEKK